MLTGHEIIKQVKEGRILIEPFDKECVGNNSYDVHIGNKLLVYTEEVLDCKIKNPTKEIIIPDDGYILQPGILYLASTVEKTRSDFHIPEINGKSSLGRLGLSIHITAGFGDIGFNGKWTLEMTVVKALKIYPYQKIGQIQFDVPIGRIGTLYRDKKDAKYAIQEDVAASEMFKNF